MDDALGRRGRIAGRDVGVRWSEKLKERGGEIRWIPYRYDKK